MEQITQVCLYSKVQDYTMDSSDSMSNKGLVGVTVQFQSVVVANTLHGHVTEFGFHSQAELDTGSITTGSTAIGMNNVTLADYLSYKHDIGLSLQDDDGVWQPNATDYQYITINSINHVTDYKMGEEVDVTGLTIETVTFDGTKKTVEVTESMITEFDTSEKGFSRVWIEYEGRTTSDDASMSNGARQIIILSATQIKK